MPEPLIQVGSYPLLPQASFAKLRLEAEGIPVFLIDAEVVSMDWMLGNAVGFIKIKVPESRAAEAQQILADLHDQQLQDRHAETFPCLKCGEPVPDDVTVCPACGQRVDFSEQQIDWHDEPHVDEQPGNEQPDDELAAQERQEEQPGPTSADDEESGLQPLSAMKSGQPTLTLMMLFPVMILGLAVAAFLLYGAAGVVVENLGFILMIFGLMAIAFGIVRFVFPKD